jgi:hypothetical protein
MAPRAGWWPGPGQLGKAMGTSPWALCHNAVVVVQDEWTPYILGGQTDGGQMDTVYFRRTEDILMNELTKDHGFLGVRY